MNHYICSSRFRTGPTKAKIAMDNNLSKKKKKRMIFSPYNMSQKHLGRKKKFLENVFDFNLWQSPKEKKKKKKKRKRKTKQKQQKKNKTNNNTYIMTK